MGVKEEKKKRQKRNKTMDEWKWQVGRGLPQCICGKSAQMSRYTRARTVGGHRPSLGWKRAGAGGVRGVQVDRQQDRGGSTDATTYRTQIIYAFAYMKPHVHALPMVRPVPRLYHCYRSMRRTQRRPIPLAWCPTKRFHEL